MRPRSNLRRTIAALVLLTLAGIAPPARAAGDGSGPPRTETLLLTHSWSGRTALVGHTWAEMLGARFLRFSDAPDSHSFLGIHGKTGDEIRPQLALERVRRLYVGFPIWNLGPAPPAWRLLEDADLQGVEVVPFFTYLHHVNEEAVDTLRGRLERRGAEVLPHVALRIPAAMNPSEIVRVSARALLERTDLWASGPLPRASCSRDAAPEGHELCTIPAGSVWLDAATNGARAVGQDVPRRIDVGAFRIDRREVTIAQYERCEKAGRCPLIERFDPCSRLVGDGDDKPMPCVSVDAARAYCEWVGMRLPDEAEWVRAARGESAAPYPWGSVEPGSGAVAFGNFGERRGKGMPEYSLVEPDARWTEDGVAMLAAPCSFPAGDSPFGVCDLAGNIGEWVEPVNGRGTPVFKGGTWMDAEPWSFAVTARGRMSLDRTITAAGYYLTGFRCARSALDSQAAPVSEQLAPQRRDSGRQAP